MATTPQRRRIRRASRSDVDDAARDRGLARAGADADRGRGTSSGDVADGDARGLRDVFHPRDWVLAAESGDRRDEGVKGRIFSVGHGARPLEEFVALLEEAGIETLVD